MFFLSGSRGDCRETNAEPAADKERANFCDWFSLNAKFRAKSAGHQAERQKADSSKTAFDKLFN
jgi:hypothetical protein